MNELSEVPAGASVKTRKAAPAKPKAVKAKKAIVAAQPKTEVVAKKVTKTVKAKKTVKPVKSGKPGKLSILAKAKKPGPIVKIKKPIEPEKPITAKKITKVKKVAKKATKPVKTKKPFKPDAPSKTVKENGPTSTINLLFSTGYFTTKRNMGEIVKHINDNLKLPYKITALSGLVNKLVKDKKLKREVNAENKKYEYLNA